MEWKRRESRSKGGKELYIFGIYSDVEVERERESRSKWGGEYIILLL